MKMSLVERLRSLSQDPVESVRMIGVETGQTVVDLGAGKGYFALPAADVVGGNGRVFAVEPDVVRCKTIREKLVAAGVGNVKVLETVAEDLHEVPERTVDLAFSAFTFHHFRDKARVSGELRRVLKPGGVFYLWDRVPGFLISHGTQPGEAKSFAAGFSRSEVISEKRVLRVKFWA